MKHSKPCVFLAKTHHALPWAFILCCCLLGTGAVRAQIINTVAGNGSGVFAGDGGPATSAAIPYPIAVALDGTGNIYILDHYNRRIRKVETTTGMIRTVAGDGSGGSGGDGGPATIASLNQPCSIAVDGADNIYIADAGSNRVRKVSAATGIITTVAGNGTPGFTGDGGSATSALLNFPQAVAVDGAGDIYILDAGNFRIRKVTAATGIINTVGGDGVASFAGDGGPATSASLQYSLGIAIDGSGNIFVSDNNRIRKITAATGVINTVAGDGSFGFAGDGNAATSASLNNPKGMALDGSGNLYIADYRNNRIRKVTTATGIISTVAGNGTDRFTGDGGAATSASLYAPSGVAIDNSGNIYIADENNHRIRKVTNPVSVSATTTEGAYFRISPVPATGMLTIETNDAALNGKPASLTDMLGRIQQRLTLVIGRQHISLAGLQPGIYILHIANCASYKIVKE